MQNESEGHTAAYDRAFSGLAAEIAQSILSDTSTVRVVRMRDLCEKFVSFLHKEGISLESYWPHHMKHLLLQYFGDRLLFFRNKKNVAEPEVVAASTVPKLVLLEHTTESMRMMYEGIVVMVKKRQSY